MRDLAYEVCGTPHSERDQSPCERSLAPLGMTGWLFLKPGGDSFALLEQFFGHNAAQRTEELSVLGQLLRPFFMIDPEKFGDTFMFGREVYSRCHKKIWSRRDSPSP